MKKNVRVRHRRLRSKVRLVVGATLLVFLLPIIAISLYKANRTQAAWYNSSWAYRAPITITNNGSTQTDYQVSVQVDTYYLINTSKLQSDCDDLRFTSDDGTTLLTHWTEYCANTSSQGNSVVWVTLSSIPAGATTIYMYYGNGAATGTSSFSSLPTGLNFGSGKDGSIELSATTDINTTDSIYQRACSDTTGGDAVIYLSTVDTTAGASSIRISSAPTVSGASKCIEAGDEVLIITLSGANTGTFETARINSFSTNSLANDTLNLNHALANSYSGSTQKVVVQRIPNYSYVALTSTATLSPSGFDGNRGGVLMFRANGNGNSVAVGSSSSIHANFRGGNAGPLATGGARGGGAAAGGAAGTTGSVGAAARGNGAGGNATGGVGGEGGPNGVGNSAAGGAGGGSGGAGGGGGYGNAGAAGNSGANGGNGGIGVTTPTALGGNKGTGGSGGASYGNDNFQTSNANLIFGSGGAGGAGGGGGGGADRNTSGSNGNGGNGGNSGAGGNGGGIVAIFARTISNSGNIAARGENGSLGGAGNIGNGSGGNLSGGGGGGGAGGPGGGGSGGAIWLAAGSLTFGTVSGIGGNGGVGVQNGGAGGACGTGTTDGGGGGGGGNAGGAGQNSSCNFPGNAGNASGAWRGGNGGVGRVFAQYSTSSGSSTPAATTQTLPIAGDVGTELSYANYSGTRNDNYAWKFDEGSGTTTRESTAGVNTGTLSGSTTPAWRTAPDCIAGPCLSFNGSTAYVSLAYDVSVKTFSVWVKPRSFAATQTIVDFGSTSYIDINTSGVLVAGAGITSPTLYLNGKSCTTCTLALNEWSQIGFSTGTTINGSSVKFGNRSTQYFTGLMDEVRIFTSQLSDAQIAGVYTARGSLDTVAVSIGSSVPSTLTNGLIGYWSMEEMSWTNNCSTSTVLDSTDFASHALACPNSTGPTGNARGIYGRGGNLDNSNDYLALPANWNILQNVSAFSGSVWIDPDTVIAGTSDVVLAVGTNAANDLSRFQIDLRSSDEISCSARAADAESAQTITTTDSPLATLGDYFHVVCTVDLVNDTMKIYVNGVERTTSGTVAFTATTTDNTTSTNSAIGADDTGTANYYDGLIDELRIYNRAITSTEVADLYSWSPGPILYFPFDENTGSSTVADASGNNYSGTMNNFTVNSWVPGKFGSGLNFDGSNDYVSVPSFQLPTQDMTYSVWVKMDTNNDEAIIADGSGANELVFSLNTGDIDFVTATSASLTVSGLVQNGQWTHIALTKGNTVKRIYVNGVQVATNTSVTPVTFNSCALLIGTDADATCGGALGNYADGILDDIRIYNYARSPSQIIEDMNGSHPAGGSPIGSQVISWKFDELNGTTAYSDVDTGTDGTISGATWTTSGKINAALTFDGSNDVVTIATASDSQVDFNSTEKFSLSSWIYVTSMPGASDEDLIVGKWDETAAAEQRAYRLYLTDADADAAGNLVAEVYDESANQVITAATTNEPLAVNTWYHVMMTFNGTTTGAASAINTYINGMSVAASSSNGSFAGLEDMTSDFTVGDYDTTDGVSGNTAFAGRIDEVQVYSGELTAAEVKVIASANSGLNIGTGVSEAAQLTAGAGNPPIMHVPFDDNTGTTAVDKSGNARNGTLQTGAGSGTARWIPGKIGSAVYLNPINAADALDTQWGRVNFSTDILDSVTAGTIEFWFKPDDNSEDQYQLMFFAGDTSGGSVNALEIIFDSTNNQVELYFVDTSGVDIVATANIPGTVTDWHHLAYTSTTSGNQLYIDGVRVTPTYTTGSSSTNFFFDDASSGTTYYNFGCTVSGSSTACSTTENYWGAIDEFKVYDYVRTASQIAYDYNRGAPLAHWKFDDCTGATANDSSGRGYSLTITPGAGSNTAVGTCSSGNSAHMWNDGTSGKFNYSLGFDGSDDYASSASTTIFDGSNAYTVSLWMYPNSSGEGGFGTMFTKEGVLNVYLNGTSIELCQDGGSCLGTIANSTSNSYSTGTWQMVTIVHDGSGNFTFYVNGKNRTSDSTGPDANASGAVVIGAENAGSSSYNFDGRIDDVRIYPYALSATEINKVLNEGASIRFGPSSGAP